MFETNFLFPNASHGYRSAFT